MTGFPPGPRSHGHLVPGRFPHPGGGGGYALLLSASLLLGIAFPHQGHAQGLHVRNYTQADGLPQIQIYAIHQDSRGFLWVGSNAGVARYDGRRFHSITAGDGLISNTVVSIGELPSGTIVVGSRPGICFLDPGEITCVSPAEGLATGSIRSLAVDENGDVWAAGDGGVSLVRSKGGEIRTFGVEEGLPSTTVYSILRDAAGTLWAGSPGGLFRFDGLRWEEVPVAGISGTRAIALLQDGDQFLVGNDRGLFAFRDGRFDSLDLGEGQGGVTHLGRGSDGTIWAFTDKGLVQIQAGRSLLFSAEDGVPGDEIWKLLVDREDNVWMGHNDGLAKMVPGPFSRFTLAQGLPHSFVRAITQTPDGVIWFGTRDGLAVWNGDGMTELPFRGLVPDPRVYSLVADPAGGILVGTPGGLVSRSPSGELHLFRVQDGLPDDFIYGLVPDGKGGVWVGTGGGVVLWESGEILPPPHPGLSDAPTLSMATDEAGRLWVGLISGGILVLEGDSLRGIGPEEGLTAQAIWSLAVDGAGGVWAGTNGDGAFHITPAGIRQFTVDDRLGDNFVWQTLQDRRGDIWFFTGRGLNRLSGDRMFYYATAEGLDDLEGSAAAALEASSGDIWFGTGTGVYRYQPALDRESPPPSRIYLESITVGGKQVSTDSTRFQPRPGVITFRFSAPSFRAEEGIRFRYRLAGSDDEWSEPSPEPLVSFARLGHGDYLLEVEAETSQGRRTPEAFSLPFSVLPSFYQTLWFRGGSAGLLLLALTQIPGLRARHLEVERKRLEGLVRERTREIQENALRLEEEIHERKEAEKARESLESQLRQAQKMEAVGRLAGGIAHDFNNLLTSVLGHTELLSVDANPDSDLARDLEEIRKSAQRGAALVSQLLAFSRQQVVLWQPVDICASIQDTAGMVGRVMGPRVKLELDLCDSALWVRGDPNQLGQVILNLAVNARDAMTQGGTLLIGAAARVVSQSRPGPFSDTVPPGNYVCLLVSDTGDGMEEGTLRQIFEPFFTTKEVGKGSGLGLASVYGIVHQHGGFIQVSSAPGQGTRFEIYFPRSFPRTPSADSGPVAELPVHEG